MKKLIKNFPFIYHALLSIKHKLWLISTNKNLKTYLANHETPKLQLGAGTNNLVGWFNTDYFPRENIYFMDVTKRFPIPSNSIHFIFSEHHIEHISYKSAVEMIKESFRVLEPGGYIKIATPDLKNYINSYIDDIALNAEISSHAKNWIYSGFYNAKKYIPVDNYFKAHFVNDIFLNYEHQFIYDFESLSRILQNAGFTSIVNCSLKISIHLEFHNIETHINNFDQHFTLCVEARRPL